MFGDRRAVSIRCAAGCCRAVAEIDGKRFVADEAPRLPLAACSHPADCSCDYEVVADRRDDYRPAAARSPARGLLRFLPGKRSTDVA